jgi:LuxR family maltose regulon positive regulatory protein
LSVLALALEALGQSGEADATLAQAFFLARPEGYTRLFLDTSASLSAGLGWPLGKLLERSAASAPFAGDYGRDLLAAFRQEREAASFMPTSAEALADPLTERELEVLHLLAEGLSNQEIGNRLVVAPNTVKQHLKNIYGKLDVHSRTQAVARGRELALLQP